MDLAIKGVNPRILGYSSIGDIVPEVRMTQGKRLQIGVRHNEQSRQDSVSKGSDMFPSIG